MDETAVGKKKQLNEIDDFNVWLEKGIDKLSDQFNKLVPKEIAYQYIDRLKQEGWLETAWDYLEALRAFRLYFVLYELDNQLMGILQKTKGKISSSDIELRETWRHILRDFSKSTMELHKTLSDVLDKAGLSKVANKGLAEPGNNIITDLFNIIKNDNRDDTTQFDIEMRLFASKRQKRINDPNQASVFEDKQRELSDAEYEEIQQPADAG
jgi:hypothetical protein